MNRNKLLVFCFLIIAGMVGIALGTRWLHYYLTHASTDDARVKADLIKVSPTVKGKIRLVLVEEGDRVHRGQLIAQIEEDRFQANVTEAEGEVRIVEAQLRETRTELKLVKQNTEKKVEAAAAELKLAQAHLDETRAVLRQTSLHLRRMKNLQREKSASRSDVDKAQSSNDVAVARVVAANQEVEECSTKLDLAEVNTGQVALKEHKLEELKARLNKAQGTLSKARLDLEHTRVSSPIDGIVAKKVKNTGEFIKPGQPLAILVDLDHVWVEADLEETKMAKVKIDQPVDITVDAYPELKFRGRVANIGAAASSVFALIPENRSAGNFTKVTQRIPIRIALEDPPRRLRPGMMVTVGIVTGGDGVDARAAAAARSEQKK